MSIRVGKVNYNPSDKPQDAPVHKQQAKKKFPPLLGGFEAIQLPKTGYIPFTATADSNSSNTMAARQ